MKTHTREAETVEQCLMNQRLTHPDPFIPRTTLMQERCLMS